MGGLGLAPGHVDVDAHGAALAERPLDGGDMGDVRLKPLRTDLELEDAVTAQVEHPLSLGNVLRRVA
ncbi:hypothetical protein D3C72_1950460 [compost metagenome]